MNIVYAATYDARDVNNWSGTGYYISKALIDQDFELAYIAPTRKNISWKLLVKRLWYERILNQRYLLERDPSIVKSFGEQLSGLVKSCDCDLVFSPGTLAISFMDTDKPIVFWTDSIFGALNDFYLDRFNLCKESQNVGHEIDQIALDRVKLAIFSSDWAADYARENYSVDPVKIKVVPFGANIQHEPSQESVKQFIADRSFEVCRVLFVGVDWKRKGGQIVFDTVKEINKQGVAAQLTIVGCTPPEDVLSCSFVNSLGFISKREAGGQEKLEKLFAESHFFMMPAHAEAYGIVYCEANAFGVPCLAKNIGGVPTIIKNGKNGQLFAPDANTKEYASWIIEVFADPKRYHELALSSFAEYKARLNWNSAGKQVKKILNDIL